MMYTRAVIEPAMFEKVNNVESNRASSGWGDFDLMIKVFDDALRDREWILGERFSAADLMLGSTAVFLRMFGLLPDNRNIGDYADQCLARPTYVRAL